MPFSAVQVVMILDGEISHWIYPIKVNPHRMPPGRASLVLWRAPSVCPDRLSLEIRRGQSGGTPLPRRPFYERAVASALTPRGFLTTTARIASPATTRVSLQEAPGWPGISVSVPLDGTATSLMNCRMMRTTRLWGGGAAPSDFTEQWGVSVKIRWPVDDAAVG